jgi:hypothetical protein
VDFYFLFEHELWLGWWISNKLKVLPQEVVFVKRAEFEVLLGGVNA